MNKTILDKTQLSLLVFENRYLVNKQTKFLSRCIDGRYANEKNLPALAFPGADAGELALILGTANCYGFEVDRKKIYRSLVEVIGGEKNLCFHTDSHGDTGKVLAGCGHIKQMSLTPSDYQMTQEEIEFIKNTFNQAVKRGVVENILQGDHMEGAVVYIKGNYGIYPQYTLKMEGEREINTQIFEYHQSLVDERHQVLCNTWLRDKAVKLPDGCDENYLYQVLSETADAQTLETVKRLAKGLPIYQVNFDDGGMFEVEELGNA